MTTVKKYLEGRIHGKYRGVRNENIGEYYTDDFELEIYDYEITGVIHNGKKPPISARHRFVLKDLNDVKINLSDDRYYRCSLKEIELFHNDIDEMLYDIVYPDSTSVFGTLTGSISALVYENNVPSDLLSGDIGSSTQDENDTSTKKGSKPAQRSEPYTWKQFWKDFKDALVFIPMALIGVGIILAIVSVIAAMSIEGQIAVGIGFLLSLVYFFLPKLFFILISPFVWILNLIAKFLSSVNWINFIFLIVFLSLFVSFINAGFNSLAGIAVLFSIFFLLSFFSSFLRISFSGVFYSFGGIFLLFVGLNNLNQDIQPIQTTLPLVVKKDSIKNYVEHTLRWSDYKEKSFEGSYTVLNDALYQSKSYRNGLAFSPAIFDFTLTPIFRAIHEEEQSQLSYFESMLDSIRKTEKLDKAAFVQLVVSCIQTIPYSSILPYQCSFVDVQPCISNVQFGLYSPTEFLYTLNGDCDTRALLLFTLLSNFGYDVAILTSNRYQHAVLGINLPLSGEYILYQGKKYYVWETTSQGWIPGILPPSCKEIKYWDIALTSSNEEI